MSLAIASSAAAINLPVGSSSDSTTTKSLYGALNGAAQQLGYSAGYLDDAGDDAVAGITSTNVTVTDAYQIYADFVDMTEGAVMPTGNYVQALQDEFGGGQTGQQNYDFYASQTAEAATRFAQVTQLLAFANDDAKDYPNGLFTIDGDLAVSSTATVTKVDTPTALTLTFATTHAAAGGFVVPAGFTFTLPSGLLLKPDASKELTLGQVADPVPADAVGTVTIDSPAAKQLSLSSTKVISGKIYVVDTEPSPSLELYLGNDTSLLAGLPGSSSGPLTVTLPEFVANDAYETLPMSSLSLSFPAKTSFIYAPSCSKLGAVTGTASDVVAPLAQEYFSDFNDGDDGGDSYPVTLTASATKVTDDCPAATPAGGAAFTGAKTKNGVAQLKVQKTYTITDHSGTKPLYLGFAKAPKVPSGKGTAFKGVGGGNWAITVTVTDEMLKDHTVDFAYKVKSKVYVLKAKISS